MPFAAAYETRLQNRLIESLIFSAHVENPCRQLVKKQTLSFVCFREWNTP